MGAVKEFDLVEVFQPTAVAMPVVDPLLKEYGRLWIPARHIEPTKALRRWLAGVPNQASLCILHQKGDCHGGNKCNQAHVRPEYVALVREALLSRSYINCCLQHGDLASRRIDFRSVIGKRGLELKAGTQVMPFPLECLAITAYFECYMSKGAKLPRPGSPSHRRLPCVQPAPAAGVQVRR
eukprot:TRINITY_DN8284_c0_g1_i1.p1 TRINITY_DN8284_c0_g1~~TRINITY_DN8284_c0_g1_i1.p1  ORF type:complete len:191 (+),score=44.07 TRINITY_DN8284_c0_g1_i1:33-575(+)